MASDSQMPGIWFPTVDVATGVSVFTRRLADGLAGRGYRAEISWLPKRAEYLPWIAPKVAPPSWAQVVHVNSWLHPRFFAGFGLPVVVTFHGSTHDPAALTYKGPLQRAYHRHWVRRMERSAVSAADAVTAVSDHTADQVRRSFARRDVEVIPNWLPAGPALPVPCRESPGNPFRILFVGSWSKRKGVDLLPEIARRLGPGFELAVSHDPARGPLPAGLTALPWTTDPDEVRRWMEDADALLLPSRSEGLPLVVVEALAAGLPVVATDTASLPEIVTPEVNGLLCPVDDVAALVAACRRLRDEPGLWAALSRRAPDSLGDRYTLAHALDAYAAIYRAVSQA